MLRGYLGDHVGKNPWSVALPEILKNVCPQIRTRLVDHSLVESAELALEINVGYDGLNFMHSLNVFHIRFLCVYGCLVTPCDVKFVGVWGA